MGRIVVTGANRGIGYEIARLLAVQNHEVIMTARDLRKGDEAISALKAEGLDPELRKLDVGSELSVQQFVQKMANDFGQLDGLVNNAGVFLDRSSSLEQVEMPIFRQTMEIDFFGPMLLIRGLLPLLRMSQDARVINLSSGLGALNGMSGGYSPYRISKTAINAMTAIFAAELAGDNVLVNAVCPGWVQTEMGGTGATRTVEQGADTPVWMMSEDRSTLPNGKFLRDRQVLDW